MKYTALLLVAALCLQLAVAKKDGKKSKPDHLKKGPIDLLKGKREAALTSYPSSGPYRSSHILHLQPAGGSLSIGAGYSLGGSKSPSFGHSGSFGNSASFGGSHFPGLSSLGSHGFGGGHGGYSYPKPSTGFGGHGLSKMRYTSIGNFQNGNSLSGFGGGKFGGVSFSGGSHGAGPQFSLSSAAPQSFGHSFSGSKPQLSYGSSQYAAFAKPAESYASQAATYGVPVIAGNHGASSSSLPSYASGIKGLGAYASSGSHPSISGPLFTPAGDHEMFGSHSGSFGGFGGAGGGHGNLFAPEGNFGSGNSIGSHIFSSPSKKLSELLNSQSGKSAFGGGSVTSFKPSVYVGSSEGGSGGHGSASFGQHSAASSYGAPSFGHSALLSGSPIYLAPKVLAAAGSHAPSFESHSSGGGGQSAAFHGSASLSGSYEIPSAGHSASSLSFGSLGGSFGAPSGGHSSSSLGFGSSGGSYGSPSASYGSPSASYGSPSFGHDSDSSSYLSPSVSHGSISAGHGIGSSIGSISGGYSMGSLGHGGLSGFDGMSGDSSIPTSGYSSVIKHGDSGASSYASSSPYGGSGYAGSSGYNLNEISAGKQELPLSSGMHAFSSGGQGGSALISSFDEHNFNSAQGSYGLPKGSYSSQSNVYVSPVEENYGEQRENKYDTIKYSRAISEDEILKH